MSDINKLGVGVIGCGNISTIYLRNMPNFRDLRLVACADLRPEVARDQAGQFGIEALTIEALLARPDIQVVVNLTTPNAHFAVSHAALTAGKHVFGEKPITVEAADAAALVREAAQRGLKLGCAPDTFLGGGGRTARELIDAGRIGKVLYGTCFLMSHGMEHWHPDPTFFFKPGGGPILDMGPYYLAALINLLGSVTHVQGRASSGFATRLVRDASVYHKHGLALGGPTGVLREYLMIRNVYLFWTTYLRGWRRWRYRLRYPPWVLSRCLDAQLRGRADAEAYIASAGWDALRGHWGSWESRGRAPASLRAVARAVLGWHPYFWAMLLAGDFRGLIAATRARILAPRRGGK